MAKKAGGGATLVVGDKLVDSLLKGLPLRVQKAISRKATRRAAKEIVLPDAQRRTHVKTGELRKSLVVKAIKRNRIRFGHQVQTRDGFFLGDQFYGAFLEFGTKERKHNRSKKAVGRIDSDLFAFLRPAVYENEPRIISLYVKAMRELLTELSVAKQTP